MSHPNDTGTVLPHEVDELTHYLFHNYRALMTVAEGVAYMTLMVERKAQNSSDHSMRRHRRQLVGSNEAEIMALLAGGSRQFLIATRDRILRDHSDKIFLNRCPKCGALARTPEACLCPSCSHTWYEMRIG